MCGENSKCSKCSAASQASFIGQTPFVNPSINGYDGFASLAEYNSANGTSPTTAPKDSSITSWIKTVLPVLDKVAGVNPTPDTPSDAYSYDINKPAPADNSNTILWVVVGVVVLLLVIWAFVKLRKK